MVLCAKHAQSDSRAAQSFPAVYSNSRVRCAGRGCFAMPQCTLRLWRLSAAELRGTLARHLAPRLINGIVEKII